MDNATKGGLDAPETHAEPPKKTKGPEPLTPRVKAALEQYEGSRLVRLTRGYVARDEDGQVAGRFRQVVIRPSTLQDEIRRDVELVKLAQAEVEKAGGQKFTAANTPDRILELQSSALSVAAMLVQVIVAWDEIPKVTIDHLRELTRTDVNMLQDGLAAAEEALVEAYQGNE